MRLVVRRQAFGTDFVDQHVAGNGLSVGHAHDALRSAAPAAVVIDLQVGSMGGMAIARELHQQAALNGEDGVPVVLLLDRKADSFLAKRSGVAAWVIKPFTAHDIRTAVESALGG